MELFRHPTVVSLGKEEISRCHFTFVKVSVAQSCLTLCNPMNCSLPGSSVHGILQARILKWVAIPFSKGSSWPRDQTWVSYNAGRFFTVWATREAPEKRFQDAISPSKTGPSNGKISIGGHGWGRHIWCSEALSDSPCPCVSVPLWERLRRRCVTTGWSGLCLCCSQSGSQHHLPPSRLSRSDVSSCTGKWEYLLLIRISALHLLPLAEAEPTSEAKGWRENPLSITGVSHSANPQLLVSTHEWGQGSPVKSC